MDVFGPPTNSKVPSIICTSTYASSVVDMLFTAKTAIKTVPGALDYQPHLVNLVCERPLILNWLGRHAVR